MELLQLAKLNECNSEWRGKTGVLLGTRRQLEAEPASPWVTACPRWPVLGFTAPWHDRGFHFWYRVIVHSEWRCCGIMQFLWNLDASLFVEGNGVLILYVLTLASLYHNFPCFHWKKNKNWILQPYNIEKEFLTIFFYVCWFENAAPRRSLHFRVTFFLYHLIYRGWLKAEQHLNGEFFHQYMSLR